MDANTNYYYRRDTGAIEIPEFLSKKMNDKPKPQDLQEIDLDEDDFTDELVSGINEALNQGKTEREANAFHLKELDKVADAYTEDEARVIVKRLVSNYPDIVLGEVVNLIKDMQELSGAILKNSRIFATKRGEV